MQTLLLVVPKYFVGANADNIGSKEPISSVFYLVSDKSHEQTRLTDKR